MKSRTYVREVSNLSYLPLLLTAGVVGYGWWSNRKTGRTAHDVLEADKHAAERIEDKLD